MRVHPRACGGNGFYFAAPHLDKGPSPRVRGKRPGRDTGHISPGPSPRVRGKLPLRASRVAVIGSIPARAGETHFGQLQFLSQRVHPRACGGNPGARRCARAAAGPSPRVRGKPGPGDRDLGDGGSIPARAGETRWFRSRWHLRSTGPSPRVRGKLRRCLSRDDVCGSIPARAGETPGRLVSGSGARVHPRACGGNSVTLRPGQRLKGPSPRVRGKQTGFGIGPRSDGSIPARAGETPSCPG